MSIQIKRKNLTKSFNEVVMIWNLKKTFGFLVCNKLFQHLKGQALHVCVRKPYFASMKINLISYTCRY